MSQDPNEAVDDRPDALLQLLAGAERLESLPRTGWLVCGVQHPESVAAHSYGVALVALWLAEHVEEEVDAGRVAEIALLHDVGEALLTDLPRPVKELIGTREVAEAEERAAKTLLADAPASWRSAVSDYKNLESPEARLVKAADRIQMLAKSLQYRAQHRGVIDNFWQNKTDFDGFGFPLVRSILDRLRAHYDAGTWVDVPDG